MILESELVLAPADAHDTDQIRRAAIKALKLDDSSVTALKILKRSIDARSRKAVFRLKVQVYIGEVPGPERIAGVLPNVSDKTTVLIVGAGPAGLFAAMRCIENGLKPVVIERGKTVKDRRRDLALINKEGTVPPDSNYCFGEGGAGTYSDGKLYTRSNKRGDVKRVLQTFVDHGASPDILVDARPHIGTNKLPQIIESMRAAVLAAGGEIHFESRVTELLTEKGRLLGARLADGTELRSDVLIFATGHSARDSYQLLYDQGLALEAKPFALGVRIEHPQRVIDKAQYHEEQRSEFLPPSYYSLVEQVDGRGVFSFCMCPGGIIAPCATQNEEIVVNGWSPSKRNNPFANSGTVVQIEVTDVPGKADDPFLLLNFQAEVERKAWLAGGGKQVAPAQRMIDFVEGRVSKDLPENSYLPGVKSVDLTTILPPFVSRALRKALPVFGQKMPGYYTNDAILVGVESRTSSPVRIPRDKVTFQHPQLVGLFPCGEGAGYAGGIVSAAIDGMNCADACFIKLMQ